VAVAHPGKVARHHPRGGASCGDEGAAHPAGGPDAPAEQRLAKERPLLAALPSLQLRIGPAPVLRKVDKLSCVRIGSARYSVPMTLIGASVEVLAGSGRVLIRA